ncbi:MAG: hypothetical protein WCI77_03735 [Candidatus Omnitrophota bacterium]
MRYVLNIIAILIVVAITIGIIQYRQHSSTYPFEGTFKQAYKNLGKTLRAKEKEVLVSVSPDRKRALTFITKETALRELVPELFGTFDEQEWEYFWGLLYDPMAIKKGKKPVKTYRSRDEIESVLRDRYSETLGYYDDAKWFALWKAAGVDWSQW